MAVLIFVEGTDGKFKKAAFEAVTYGAKIAAQLNVPVNALCENVTDDAELKTLGKYGAQKIWKVTEARLQQFDPSAYAKLIHLAAEKINADVVIFSHNFSSKAIAPILSGRWKAGFVPGAIDLPKINGAEMEVKKNVFSGKAFAVYSIHSAKKIISLLPNSIPPEEKAVDTTVEEFNPQLADTDFRTKVKEVHKASGTVTLADADIVVSGGRGMKGPENWGMLEEMAKILGAATACSRPVADTGWRPHAEHVGQTGLTIRPNLYIAIGISGAIQHLAGVNGSKVIVVINMDAEAPFFKAADYGIVGDAFKVVPKLNEAFKKFKAGT
jgi:electron transfer flavoprotein alpha subunit